MQNMPMNLNLQNTYITLPELFYTKQELQPVKQPKMLCFNKALFDELVGAIPVGVHNLGAQHIGTQNLGAQHVGAQNVAEVLCGNKLPTGATPIAQAYAGHQFGHFTMLGDGRALLLGEVVAPDGARFDLHLKGAGPTVYARRGDGRAALGPMLREYIVSEAMHGLGIPTTRSLAVVGTGEYVLRQEGPLPGGVLARIAASHIRVGTFEYAAKAGGAAVCVESVRALADYSIRRHYPHVQNSAARYLEFFKAVCAAQAKLVAQWMGVGFIHGVMNTDNMSISGETIDYGPCAFMDEYHEGMVFSSIDRQGRYAYGNQPRIAQWNLARLAEALLPLFDADKEAAVLLAKQVLDEFIVQYAMEYRNTFRKKLGLSSSGLDDSKTDRLIKNLLAIMQSESLDFTNTFRALCVGAARGDEPSNGLVAVLGGGADAVAWVNEWRACGVAGGTVQVDEMRMAEMRAANPVYIPRNHLVERALQAAVHQNDFAELERLVLAVATPFDERPEFADYTKLPSDSERVQETFCGT